MQILVQCDHINDKRKKRGKKERKKRKKRKEETWVNMKILNSRRYDLVFV